MAEKEDLSNVKKFISWALYGLSATIATVASVAYIDMRVQRNNCTEENNYYARESFNKAMQINAQQKVLQSQDTAIIEAKNYIKDSINVLEVKNYNGKLKIKK